MFPETGTEPPPPLVESDGSDHRPRTPPLTAKFANLHRLKVSDVTSPGNPFELVTVHRL